MIRIAYILTLLSVFLLAPLCYGTTKTEILAKERMKIQKVREFALLHVPDTWELIQALQARRKNGEAKMQEYCERLYILDKDRERDPTYFALRKRRNEFFLAESILMTHVENSYIQYAKFQTVPEGNKEVTSTLKWATEEAQLKTDGFRKMKEQAAGDRE